MSRRGITHVKPNEAQGIAKSPNFSSAHTASGFSWGIRHLATQGVYNIPNAGKNTVATNVNWGSGFQKP